MFSGQAQICLTATDASSQEVYCIVLYYIAVTMSHAVSCDVGQAQSSYEAWHDHAEGIVAYP